MIGTTKVVPFHKIICATSSETNHALTVTARAFHLCIHASTGRASSSTESTIVKRSGLKTPGFTCHQ
jgi:hypothetical protein